MGWTFNTAENVANEGPQIAAIAIVFTAASLAFLTLRFYVRGRMIKAIGAGESDTPVNGDRFRVPVLINCR